MSWLYVQGLGDSSSELSLPSALLLASSVTSKGKPMQPRYWLRVWKTESWIRRLSGVTCDPSTAAHGVAAWISSLQATRANPSAAPASDSGPPTPDTCGPTSPASSTSASPGSCSARTSALICGTASTSSPETWKAWATALRRHCAQRRNTARGTSASAYSGSQLLPTPTAQSYGSNQGGAAGRTGPVRHGLQSMAKAGLWPTPTTGDAKGARTYAGGNLTLVGAAVPKSTAQLWPTPTAADGGGGLGHAKSAQGGPNLRTTAGGSLNPPWVEWLMGWPEGWTDSEQSVTESYRKWLRAHFWS